MAATPSKPSPTGSKDAGGDSTKAATASLKAAPPITATAASAASLSSSLKAVPPPTYHSAQTSRCYTIANLLMKQGDFETALTTIEEGLESTKAALFAAGGSEDDEECMLHESLAPFHYLYGTTLLYSIEESQDATQPMTNDNPTTTTEQEEEEGSGAVEQQQEAEEEVMDDTQIAWENLDTARTILERMVQQQQQQADADYVDKLKEDLAQVYLREGDLSRNNSAYDNAIDFYNKTLALRNSNTNSQRFDRKIADVHYNLGLVYFLQLAETKIPEGDDATNTEQATAAAITQKLAQARTKGFVHYWECAKQLAGLLLKICDDTTDPNDLLAQVEQQQVPVSNLKTTGEDEDDVDDSKIIGLKLQALRKLVSQFKAPPTDQQERLVVYHEFMELLDEIQETVDEQENSVNGVHQVTEMKQQIAAAVAAQHQHEQEAENDSAFGSSEAAASTAAAQTVMMVRKKKKKKRNENDQDEEKVPAAAQSPVAKRPKAAE